MNLKPLKISDQYYHTYVSFSKYEINKFYTEATERLEFNSDIKLLSNSEKEILIDEIKSRIEEEIEQAIMELDIVIISEILYIYRGQIAYDNPLFVIAKMCTVPEDLELVFPDTILNLQNMKCIDNVLKVILNSLLISEKFIDLVEVEQCSSTENVIVVEAIVDGQTTEFTIDWQDEDSFVDFDLLFGYNIGDEIPSDFINLNNISYAKIKNIYLKQPKELTDEIVKKLNIFNVKTKDEFIKKIVSVIENRQNRNFAVTKILDYVIKNSNIVIEEIVIEHFMHLIAKEFSCSVEEIKDEWNELEDDHLGNLVNQIKKQYIVHYAYRNNVNYITDEYYKTIKEEYNLHRALMLVDNNIQDYEMFLREQLDFMILYNFFTDEGLILK